MKRNYTLFKAIDACFNNDCQQGTCILDPNDSNAYSCECDEDYAGPKCEIRELIKSNKLLTK